MASVPGDTNGQAQQVRYGRKIAVSESELMELQRFERPYRPRAPRRGSRLKVLAVVMAVVVVAAVVLAYLFLWPKGNTPAEAFQAWVDAMNDEDGRATIECTVLKFADESTKSSEIWSLEAMFDEWGDLEIAVHSLVVAHYDEVSAEVRLDLDEISDEAEAIYNVDIRDICIVNFEITWQYDGEVSTNDGALPFVKIGSNWYLAITPSMMPL